MKKIETLFVGAGLLTALAATGVFVWTGTRSHENNVTNVYPATKYGAFLAAQHAIYVNDFESAARFSKGLSDTEYAVVSNTRMISEFLSGKLPDNAKLLKNEKSMPAGLIYDAYLVGQGDWNELYRRHKKDESALSAPLRIWASVATGHVAECLKFIDKLPTNSSWKAFARGQVYAQSGDIKKAADAFADVSPDFMNINDYLYVMSFYRAHDMGAAADALHRDFTMRPGGMYMLDFDAVPDWENFKGYENSLAFGLIQNVSHTQIMMYSDLAILLLRFAQITGPAYNSDNAAINYYLGQYFYNNTGDCEKYFASIPSDSPFHLFAVLRMADRTGDISQLAATVHENPLFVPAVNKLVAYYVSGGQRRAALRLVGRALSAENISDAGRAHFLKTRAHIYFAFGDYEDAQKDLHAASDIMSVDGEVLALQAKLWAAQNRELDNAYEYAMGLVKQNPTDIVAWDTLGAVVLVRDGVPAALDVLERVGEVANHCSSLFERLGDIYVTTGDKTRARDAYMRAIDLSDDGLSVVPVLRKKLKDLK